MEFRPLVIINAKVLAVFRLSCNWIVMRFLKHAVKA